MLRKQLWLVILFVISHASYSQKSLSYSSSKKLSTPTVFADGVISTGDYDSHPAFSPSGDTLYFIKCAPDFSTWTICVSYFRNKNWTTPEVAPFSGQYKEADPFITKDGKTLYFISTRPVEKGVKKNDTDIWKMIKTNSGWSEPIHLEAPINSEGWEYYPTVSDNGTLYFGSDRAGGLGNTDIYKAPLIDGKYLKIENLGESINTSNDEYEPFISRDESFLIFMGTSSGRGDLYVSYHEMGKWTNAERLPELICSEAVEYSPKITSDGKYFFFSSSRNKYKQPFTSPENYNKVQKRFNASGNGLGDIYQVDIDALGLKKK